MNLLSNFLNFIQILLLKISLISIFAKKIKQKTFKTKNNENDICCICLDNIKSKQNSKLICGHIFHSDCILDWFRSSKNTCPLCKDTGNINNNLINSEFNTNDINNEVVNWENHPDVQNYLNLSNSNNLTKEIIVKAYVIRDIEMNIPINEIYSSIINKLGLSDQKINNSIKNAYILYVNKELDKDIRYSINQDNYDIFYFHYYNNNENKNKKIKYQQLHQICNQAEINLHDIYNIFNMDELFYLGW